MLSLKNLNLKTKYLSGYLHHKHTIMRLLLILQEQVSEKVSYHVKR